MTTVPIWAISAVTIGGILVRPWRSAEWHWAVGGAFVLIAAGFVSVDTAARAVAGGFDVYLFLAGMLVLAELGRAAGLFETIASAAVARAAPSQRRLFFLTYATGIAVTAFLSNDGTIVLLTPAVLAAARAAGIDPVPYAFACALVANAASFILPISNPANLLVFEKLPALQPWLAAFAGPAAAAVAVTWLGLTFLFWRQLDGRYRSPSASRVMHPDAKIACAAIGAAIVAIVAASACGLPVGVWTCAAAIAACAGVAVVNRRIVTEAIRSTPWSILPLVAGLFVMIAALDRSGLLNAARHVLRIAATLPALAAAELSGNAVAALCNAVNNLPVAVIARYAVHAPHVPVHVARATLIGVDLGPNLTPAGSLATILWLMMLRRERVEITAVQFIKVGAAVTIPALLLALALATS